MIRFIVHLKVVPWNQLMRRHWTIQKNAADEAKYATMEAITKLKVKPASFPVRVHFHAVWQLKRKHDLDALYCKAVMDQMVEMGVLPDDSLEYVKAVLYTGEVNKDSKDLLMVTIEPYEQPKT